MIVLVVNCGSSSLKCRVFDMADERELAAGSVERLGDGGHAEALATLSAELLAKAGAPAAVGHRVVHGGERFREPVLVDARIEREIEALEPLAPMHNPLCLAGLRRARELFPDAAHVAVFDTAFHADLPEHAYLYALPYELYERAGVRRYGFHGSSHAWAAQRAAERLELAGGGRVVTCHLGAGCSMAAVRNGRSVDTSMGLTPLEGLPMATRSGDVDPGLAGFLARERGMTAAEVEALLNRESGLLGVSGISGDVRELEDAAARGVARAELALGLLAYRARKTLGAYLAVLGGADALVFTGGAGTHDARLRERILAGLDELGLRLDTGANAACDGEEAIVSAADSRIAVLVVPANEELWIARATVAAARGR